MPKNWVGMTDEEMWEIMAAGYDVFKSFVAEHTKAADA
jgi:hypothetical protein